MQRGAETDSRSRRGRIGSEGYGSERGRRIESVRRAYRFAVGMIRGNMLSGRARLYLILHQVALRHRSVRRIILIDRFVSQY